MTVLMGMGTLERKILALSGPAAPAQIMTLLGLGTVREAKLMVHRKTGNTGRTIHLAEVDGSHALVTAAGAAIYLEDGTKPHLITPNAAKALRWASSSSAGFRLSGKPSSAKGGVIGWRFAKVVHHPGTRPYPFMKPGAIAALQSAGVAEPILTVFNMTP